MQHVVAVREHIGAHAEKFFKSTLFTSPRLMVGLNCLDPGQSQPAHEHKDQDKFYYVVDGVGRFEIGGQPATAGPGCLVWAPAGVAHGVSNAGQQRLVLLMGIAPSPKKKE